MSSRIFVCFLCFVVGRRPGPRYCRWTIRSKDFQNAFRPRPKISMLGLDCYGPCGGTKQICVSSAQHSPLDYLRTYFGETVDLLSDERIFRYPKNDSKLCVTYKTLIYVTGFLVLRGVCISLTPASELVYGATL